MPRIMPQTEEWDDLLGKIETNHRSLRLIDLGSLDEPEKKLEDRDVISIAEKLKHNNTVSSLYLHGNNIGNEGAILLASLLVDNESLSTLDLSYNKIGNEGAIRLNEELENNHTLTSLYLKNNNVDTAIYNQIQSKIRRNCRLKGVAYKSEGSSNGLGILILGGIVGGLIGLVASALISSPRERRLAPLDNAVEQGAIIEEVQEVQKEDENCPSDDESDQLKEQNPNLENLIIKRSQWVRKEKIGKGSFYGVYKGLQYLKGEETREIAIRSISEEDLKADPKMFDNEVSNLSQLNNSQYVVNLFGVTRHKHKNSSDISKSFIMELADLSLSKYFDKIKEENIRLTENQQIILALQIACGIRDIHANNLVHNDIKDENILLFEHNAFYKAKIADLGVTKLKESVRVSKTMLMTSNKSGTYVWQAPELVRGGKPSPSTDMFSYGLLLWKIVNQGADICGERLLPVNLIELIKLYKTDMEFRLPIPNACPSLLKTIIEECWRSTHKNPNMLDNVLRLRNTENEIIPTGKKRLTANEVVNMILDAKPQLRVLIEEMELNPNPRLVH